MKDDLISRSALLKEMRASGRAAYMIVQEAPAVDAVEVVRCKDCKHFADAKGKDSGKPCGYGQCKWPTGMIGIVCADDYCSFGERRSDE